MYFDFSIPETGSHATRHPEWIIGARIAFDDQPQKSMKELITRFVLDIFRKPDLSKLLSTGESGSYRFIAG